MKLEVGELYIRNDFLYSAIILGIINDNVTYEYCNIKDGYKSMWSVDSAQFKKNYYPSTGLLKVLF
jgi:hypothetical protein